ASTNPAAEHTELRGRPPEAPPVAAYQTTSELDEKSRAPSTSGRPKRPLQRTRAGDHGRRSGPAVDRRDGAPTPPKGASGPGCRARPTPRRPHAAPSRRARAGRPNQRIPSGRARLKVRLRSHRVLRWGSPSTAVQALPLLLRPAPNVIG